jgi:hypothetical protein
MKSVGYIVLLGTIISTISVSGSGCAQPDTETQITVGLTSEALIPRELDKMKVSIKSADGTQKFFQEYDNINNRTFPGTAAVIPGGKDSLSGPLTIEVRGFSGNDEVLTRRSRLSYVPGRNIVIPMPLRMACFNKLCSADESCAGGVCKKVETLPADSLRVYKESEIKGDLGVDCFDEMACIANAKRVEVTITRPSASASLYEYECTFPVIPGSNSNVSIRWAAADNRVIVLDEGDGEEGWTLSKDKTTGKLAPGICAAYADPKPFKDPLRAVYDRALDVAVSSSAKCLAKSVKLPFCPVADGDLTNVAGSGATWVNAPSIDPSPRPIIGL